MANAQAQIEDRVDEAIGSKQKKEPEAQPVFKVIGDSKIPVSDQRGKLWKSRKAIAQQHMKDFIEAYEEARKYYRNDQLNHRKKDNRQRSGNNRGGDGINNEWTETENVVFSNVRSLAPIIYGKDPRVEMTEIDEFNEQLQGQLNKQEEATLIERLVNKLFSKSDMPGINLKPKARRAIINCQLSNAAWMLIGYTFKKDSSQEALENLKEVASKLEKAKDMKEIRRLEGELQALEKKVDLLSPEGPFARTKSITEVLTDADSTEPGYKDGNWMMYSEMLSTDFLNAVYGVRDGNTGKYKSIYEPTHILSAGSGSNDGTQEEIDTFTIFNTSDNDPKKFGFDDTVAFQSAKRTKVWMVWDKTTRRVEMYHDKNWKFPIWVWDDPYGLEEFFPLYKLSFVDDPEMNEAKGEVVYVLDQQDAINDINSQEAKARRWVNNNIFYNSSLIYKKDVEQVMKGPDGTARGLPIPEGSKLSDHIFSFAPPSLSFPEVFNKDGKFQAIDRISSMNDILRGGQFKTNTTNDAVEFVRDSNSIQIEDKTDMIEDWIGRIGFGITQLAIRFMDSQTVGNLLGGNNAKKWDEVKRERANLFSKYSMRVVGGSMAKPNSKQKKEEALKMMQMLGQFAKAAPQVVITMLKVIEKAFDEVTLTEEDIRLIKESIEAQMQRGNSQQGGQQPQQGAGGQQLPPELQRVVDLAIQRGVPPEQAVQGVLQQAGGQQPTQ